MSRGTNDARKLSFTLPTVVSIIGVVVSIVVAQYLALSGLRSDVRDILTRMDSAARINELQTKAQDANLAATKDDINEIKRRMEMLGLQYQQLRENLLTTVQKR